MLCRYGNQQCQGRLGIDMFEITQVGWKDRDAEHGVVTSNMWDSRLESKSESLHRGVGEHECFIRIQNAFHKAKNNSSKNQRAFHSKSSNYHHLEISW